MANPKVKAQVTIEFTIALLCLVTFLIATTKVFVWFANSIVARHKAYEDTRAAAGTATAAASQIDFYTPKKLVIVEKK